MQKVRHTGRFTGFVKTLLPLLLIINGCAPHEDVPIIITFDDVAGYAHHPSVSRVFAHSGNTSLAVSETVPQSIIWSSSCADLPWKFNNTITLKGWARTGSKNGSASLILSLTDSTKKNVSSDSITLDRTLLKNDIWTEFQKTFSIAPEFTVHDSMFVSLINSGQGAVYIDDLIISNH